MKNIKINYSSGNIMYLYFDTVVLNHDHGKPEEISVSDR